MLVTEMYNGQGFGNQLWCYVVTRVIAADKGLPFGIMATHKLKHLNFMNLELGQKVEGGYSPYEGAKPYILPKGIKHYYAEKQIVHPNGADIRMYDPKLVAVPDNTKIDGIMQDEKYIEHRRDEIRQWLKIGEQYEVYDYASDDVCVIYLRAGEYIIIKDVFLDQKYWNDAVAQMRKVNPKFRFVVVTDDVDASKRFFPEFEVLDFDMYKDYSILKNAHYAIIANSSFGFFACWLSTSLKMVIAPKYWSYHNISDGYWSSNYNITKGWLYLDRDGKLQDYDTCLAERDAYVQAHPELYHPKKSWTELIKKELLYQKNKWKYIIRERMKRIKALKS